MKSLFLTLILAFNSLLFAASNTLTVGLAAAYPPFESRDEKSGQIVGFDIDLAHAIGKILGKTIVIKDAEWQALLGGLRNGHYDIILSAMSKQEAGADNANFSDTYYELTDVIVTRKDDTRITKPEDLQGKVVGVQLGSGSEQVVDKLEGLKSVSRYNYNPEAFLDLKHKRIDAVVVGYAYALTQKDFATEYKLAGEVAAAELVIVMKKGQDALTAQINQALAQVKADGTYDALVKKWLQVK
ncbi:MAG: transporter substrate-binding domain-containing protein [Campylobacterales bacterium]|nr:transporter substrate-binding domain-containing protein [Campylobacterales bacterium]